jgi:hypothetical protein
MNWLCRGILAPGQLTLLTSLWKSGKTTLLSILLARMKDGGQLLGLPVRPAKVLVLSEESLDLWAMRQRRLDFGEHIGLISRPFAAKPASSDWRALIDHAGNILGADGGRLLVVDTVASLMPAGVETNADCMAGALAPLRLLAEHGIAVWLMHHPHKGKSRAGQWSRGTGSLPASVDIVLEMQAWRADDLYDRRRLLCGHSRFDETPRQLIGEARVPVAARPGKPARVDYEYVRNGTANVFMFIDAHRCWRHTQTRRRRDSTAPRGFSGRRRLPAGRAGSRLT